MVGSLERKGSRKDNQSTYNIMIGEHGMKLSLMKVSNNTETNNIPLWSPGSIMSISSSTKNTFVHWASFVQCMRENFSHAGPTTRHFDERLN